MLEHSFGLIVSVAARYTHTQIAYIREAKWCIFWSGGLTFPESRQHNYYSYVIGRKSLTQNMYLLLLLAVMVVMLFHIAVGEYGAKRSFTGFCSASH